MPAPDPARLRRTAAGAIVFDERGHLLLHRRTDNGLWSLPGGTMEIGETAAECAVREVEEETGYRVEIVRLIGIYSQPEITTVTYPDGNTVAYVSIQFEGRVLDGEAALSDETSEVGWFPPEALPEDFSPHHLPRVHDALARQETAFYR